MQYQTLTFQELGSLFSVPYCINDPYSSTKNGICSGMSEWILVYLLIPDRPETSFFQTSGWRPYQQKGPLFIIFFGPNCTHCFLCINSSAHLLDPFFSFCCIWTVASCFMSVLPWVRTYICKGWCKKKFQTFIKIFITAFKGYKWILCWLVKSITEFLAFQKAIQTIFISFENSTLHFDKLFWQNWEFCKKWFCTKFEEILDSISYRSPQ